MSDPYVQEMVRLKRKSRNDDATIKELRQLVRKQRELIILWYKGNKSDKNTDRRDNDHVRRIGLETIPSRRFDD